MFISTQISSTRGLRAKKRKEKPQNLPQYKWDMRDLQKQTGGEYTYKPLRIRRSEFF